MPSSPDKRALVLGCGGVAGGAWSIAALASLEQRLGWDARSADILIGTSAGAVLAALLAAGTPVSRLLASQRGQAPDCLWDHDTATGGALPPLPGAGFTGLSLLRRGLRGDVSSLTALVGALPRGRADMTPFMELIDSVVPAGDWAPHPNAWMMVVDRDTGQRVALGRDDVPAMPLNLAVCASYAVPGWCPPVTWQGRTYLDGGIASPVSADMLLGTGVQEAVVLAPMASRHPDAPRSPLARIERRVRRYMTAIVDREVAALTQAGIRVIRLEPDADDLQAIGFNMMDPGRRQRVFETALRTTERQVARAMLA
ncbi:phospholipase glycoprotein [Alcanivorax sp. S71-1-4]|uniref:patatin-like phospholipase family protein n=1 Tax=Alcanivorax sp. S71-1-4 TaxID=1177159 RepID=UPI001356E491|nr:patatin-like phospholipase family protein [Alcanivorax sp. S71-1-4]KAF0809389.1 phospholipase glycoprotein [Alcanivorax sp. S71-1-4]